MMEIYSRFAPHVGRTLIKTFQPLKAQGAHGLNVLVAQHNWGELSLLNLLGGQNIKGFTLRINCQDERKENRVAYFLSQALEQLGIDERKAFLGTSPLFHGSGNISWDFSLKMSYDLHDIRSFSFSGTWSAGSEQPLSYSGPNGASFTKYYYADTNAKARSISDSFLRNSIKMLESPGATQAPVLSAAQADLLRLFLLGKKDK